MTKDDTLGSKIVTLKEAAQALGLSYHRTWELVTDGQLEEAGRVGNVIVVEAEAVEKLKRARAANPRTRTRQ